MIRYVEDYFPLINTTMVAYSNGDVIVTGNNEIKRSSSDGLLQHGGAYTTQQIN